MAYKGQYIARGNQRRIRAVSKVFNIDNGSGTTDDFPIMYCENDFTVTHARVVYTVATDTSGAASANVKLGTAAGGAQIVGATNLGVSKAVGSTTSLALVAGGETVVAGGTIFARHTGIAATEAGEYFVQIEGFYKA